MTRTAHAVLVLASLAPGPGPAPARDRQARAATEYQVKAAFLYHFAQLVNWPPGAQPPDRQPFEVAVVGGDVFGGALDEALAGKVVHERAIRVRHYRTPGEMRSQPQVVFVAVADLRQARQVIDSLAAAPVLTVGELEGFAENGGMIGFRLTGDGRVAFDINLARASRAGLRMSSQLLKLARIVDAR